MTEATVERIARLMHAEALRWFELHGDPDDDRPPLPWERMPPKMQHRYRFVARMVLKALGH